MRNIHLSIRTTLLLVITVLTVLIASLVGSGVYRAAVNEHNARLLKHGSMLLSTAYNAEKCFSLERGASVAILYVPAASVGKLFDQIQQNRACAAHALERVLAQLADGKMRMAYKPEIDVIDTRMATLERQRYALDQAMTRTVRHRPFQLSDDIFTSTTGVITGVQTLIQKFSISLDSYNPLASQQLRFKYYIWELSEYAGREYALVGKLIAENRPPTRDQQIELLSWRGRIEFGWEISRGYLKVSGLDDKLAPTMSVAETRYLKTFDQIRDMFYGATPVSLNRRYPISIDNWLQVSAEAVGSLATLKDASLQETQAHIDKLEDDARHAIYLNLFMFVCAATLGWYSLRVISQRVIRPVNAMADALYGLTDDPARINKGDRRARDEIGKLAIALEAFQANSKQMERTSIELEDRKNYLDTVLATMMDGVIAIDASGTIQLVNSAIERMFGFERNELLGQNVTILMPAPTIQAPGRYLDPYMTSDSAGRKREAVARHRDGRLFPVEMSVARMHSPAGDTFVGTLRDITARKRAEQEREKYLRDLENSNRELDDFAYIASHDLKEPLRGLHNFSRFLLEDYGEKLDAEGREMLGTLATLTQQMEGLINSLLHYSRLGRTDLSIRSTNLNEIIDAVSSLYAITIREKKARIDVAPDLPVVVCDHVRMQEAFQNLIANALKYNDKPEPHIEIGSVMQGSETLFFVRDNGIGISAKSLDSVFKIFHRLHGRNAYGGGTGSGLAITKKIILQHGGRIWAESDGKGAGTTFFFTIPQKNDTASS